MAEWMPDDFGKMPRPDGRRSASSSSLVVAETSMAVLLTQEAPSGILHRRNRLRARLVSVIGGVADFGFRFPKTQPSCDLSWPISDMAAAITSIVPKGASGKLFC